MKEIKFLAKCEICDFYKINCLSFIDQDAIEHFKLTGHDIKMEIKYNEI